MDYFYGTALKEKLKVYFIMGSNNASKDPKYVLREAIAGGATMFQFREKGNGALQGEARLELAWKLRMLCREHCVPFLVNDDVELALAVDADGVHVGQEDEPARVVRQKIGSRILGVSAYNEEEAEQAVQQGADYIGIGPLYATGTKEDAKEASGVAVLTRIREAVTLPIVGIGGIHENNAEEVIRSGADGISVISAISRAESPRLAAAALFAKVTTALKHY